ncbi:hypothetical protein BCR33DRAFT_787193 [Rhizoclosmatium globosum]|uniref:COX assembly mitochondrial protein n=1 Tax=Rhizoclosmatium globosum TaxID=329046 RepID=A0A1Y2C1Q9_9FUNG|nr:hypothetical protein HDU79_002678 [Rhizoclosmatium sp. JEL0117]ORY40960.1 hypothetical protein BCR33DRAFT_787193 [Rhizoclosmatium globosum]|eukprot:ORY40960.1 hypothetical protein BCR33DRAFT_787193 [Rhizoclosmatium globosum]
MTYQLVILSNEEEEIAFKEMKTVALKKCDPKVAEFMGCARDRTFTGFVLCRPMLKAMDECLGQFTKEDTRDSFRASMYEKKERKMAEALAKNIE